MFRRITKSRLAVAILAVTVAVPATAMADHIFDDVPDEKFYADPAEWAFNNIITTGSPAGSSTFKPEDPVTRGESVTFLKRYHDRFVEPLIDAAHTILAVRVDHDGTLLSGPSGTTSTRHLTGRYSVDFPTDISECIWQATPTNGIGPFLAGFDQVFVALQQGYTVGEVDPDTILVRMKDENGNAFDNRFDLIVHC